MNDGATLSSIVTRDEKGRGVFPYFFCARFQHPDSVVAGRRWTTEIGLRQLTDQDNILCSVVLQTEEISARVNAPIQVTCPRIVRSLIETCNPIDHTPSRSVIKLTEENANAFAYEIERVDRKYPLILLSHQRDGTATVSAERLRRVMIGLAQVIEIPPTADTFTIENKLGRQYSAFGGAINIIFPYQKTDEGGFYRTVLLRAERLDELKDDGTSVESEILSIITHRTNVPNSWMHISSEKVKQEILRARLREAVASASDEKNFLAYEELLKEAAESLEKKDVAISELQWSLTTAEGSLDKAKAEIDGLKHALSGAASRSELNPTAFSDAITPLRDLVHAVADGNPSLEQALKLASMLYPDRLVVLDSAVTSAKESDRGNFQNGKKAVELLMNLVTTYWSALAEGRGDQEARAVFGRNGFAAKEADSLSSDGRSRRTFNHCGKQVFMEKHLKHGVKDSLSETLRIHFAWFEDRKEIVIGHCGKHLDF